MLNSMLNIKSILKLLSSMAVIFSIGACGQPSYEVTHIDARHIEVKPSTPSSSEMDDYLLPMVDSMSAVMDRVISYSPQYADKYEGRLGAWLADVSIEEVEKYMAEKGEKQGIRRKTKQGFKVLFSVYFLPQRRLLSAVFVL